MKKITTHSYLETEEFAQNFAKEVSPGDVIALYGELGSGKTTFTKGLAKGLGITDRVTSPTFVLMKDYDLPARDNSKLHHLDLYRLDSSDEIKSLDLNELVNQETNIFVIEWAQKASQEELKDAIKIRFNIKDENTREISIDK